MTDPHPGPHGDPNDSRRQSSHPLPAPNHIWWGHPLRELRWYGELARLLADPIMRGQGVPHGDGRSVLLLPGFLAADQSLTLLARFLRRIGYQPGVCGIRFNSGCGRTFDRRMIDCGLRTKRHTRSDPNGALIPGVKAHPFRGNGAPVPKVVAHPR